MLELIEIQRRLIPDIVQKMYKRYHVLQAIFLMQPVGRRLLADHLNMTERQLRTEINDLKSQKLLVTMQNGMFLTRQGEEIVEAMQHIMKNFTDLSLKEQQLKVHYNIKNVIISPGDIDEKQSTFEAFAQLAAKSVQAMLKSFDIVAVTGGSTLAEVAKSISQEEALQHIVFTAARGGLGGNPNYQANQIASTMAFKTGGNYQMLYVPDTVSPTTYDKLVNEPSVVNVLNNIKQSNIIIHGIGDAMKMAQRRNTAKSIVDFLKQNQAVGEAFGCYLNREGKVIYKLRTIGLQLEDLASHEHIFAVAGGKHKAQAIDAYLHQAPIHTVLVTDEGAANELLKGISPFEIKN